MTTQQSELRRPVDRRLWLALSIVTSAALCLSGLAAAGYGALLARTPWPVEFEAAGPGVQIDRLLVWGGVGVFLVALGWLFAAARGFRRVDERCPGS